MTELVLKAASPPDVISQHWTLQREDNSLEALSVSLLIPKDWLKYEPYKAPASADGLDLVLFGRYGDRDGKALVEVYAQKILRELSSADWFEHFARERGYRVEKRHLEYSPAGMNVDAIATKAGKDGAPFVYRMTTFKDADRVYLVSGFAHPKDYEAFSETFVVAANSFRLNHGPKGWSGEPLRPTRLTRVQPIEFMIPQTWRRESEPGDPSAEVERIAFQNLGGQRVLGQLTVATAKSRSYASHEAFLEALTHGIKGTPTVTLAPFGEGTPSWSADAQQGVAPFLKEEGKDKRTLRVVVGRADGGWVGLALVMHHTSGDPYPADAINNRAFEIVLQTIAPASSAS